MERNGQGQARSRISIKKTLLFPRRHSDSVEQATFVLYLHSCWIGWDKITDSILVRRGVDEEVGQEATETSVAMNPPPPTHIPPEHTERGFSPKTGKCSANNKKSWSENCTWPHHGDQSQLARGQRQEAAQGFLHLSPPTLWPLLFVTFRCAEKIVQLFWSQAATLCEGTHWFVKGRF